jgi:hypothetical protein
MTLGVHALVGAAVGKLVSANPLIAFAAGFGSHFLLDAIPHFDYHIRSLKLNLDMPLESDIVIGKDFARDLAIMGADCLIGFAVAIFLSWNQSSMPAVIAGALGGVVPDALQFAYYRFRKEPLISLQRFHNLIAWHVWDNPVLGISTQALSVAIATLIFFAFRA